MEDFSHIAREWPRLPEFLSWYRRMQERAAPGALTRFEQSREQLYSRMPPHVRQHSRRFEFDLFRGCWAALEYERGGGASADLERRRKQREQARREIASLYGGAANLAAALDRAAATDGKDPYAVDQGEPHPYPLANVLAQRLGVGDCRELSQQLGHLAGVLDSLSVPASIRAPGLGCVLYPDKKKPEYEGVAIISPSAENAANLTPGELVAYQNRMWQPYPDEGRPPAPGSMLAFDLSYRIACWSVGEKTLDLRPGSFPEKPRPVRGYSFIAHLLDIACPEWSGTDGQIRERARELMSPGLGWWPWPAEWESSPGHPFNGLLWGLDSIRGKFENKKAE